jgi:prevent-host-death family protein
MYTLDMAKVYSVADARARLPEILDEVEAGRDVRLSRRGRPIAVVLSSEKYEALRGARARFADVYSIFLERHALADVGVDVDFAESLRDRSPGRRVRL